MDHMSHTMTSDMSPPQSTSSSHDMDMGGMGGGNSCKISVYIWHSILLYTG